MVKISPQIESKIAFLPELPGVYLWKDKDERVIYVGKALNLSNRIKSYLVSATKDPKTEQLVKNINDLDYIITNSENEAYLLESDLIKLHKPKYNVMLKDDKRYPFVKITLNEDFPRILISRDLVKDGAKYYGPYTDVRNLRRILRTFEWIFPIRNCSRTITIGRIRYKTACINFQLKKCTAPCIGMISKDDYAKVVNGFTQVLAGRHQETIDSFREEMNKAAEQLKFEEAAAYRDKVIAVENIQKRQAVFYPDERDIDIIGFYKEDNVAIAIVLTMKSGKIVNQENYPLSNLDNTTAEEALSAFIKLHYSPKEELPDEILIPMQPQDYEELNTWLKNKLHYPQKGDKSKLIAMAKRNAFHLIEEQKLSHLRKSTRTIIPIQELKEQLKLASLPRKIVCMDISTIQGTDTVSSAVFYENGKPKKKFYRHYIIRSVNGQNDFAAMQETLERFLKELIDHTEMIPDLIVIDGGKGQLSSAREILSASNFSKIALISLAKRIEEIYLPQTEMPIILPRSSSALRLLVTIRDEAHRFAINFHRSRRSKRTLISELEAITGIGELTKFLLLKEFGSVEAIKSKSIEELAQVKNIGEKTAQAIYAYFAKEVENPVP